MAFSFSPKIVTEGLVLALDAANPRSYVSGSTVWNDLSPNLTTGSLVNGPTFNSANGGTIVFDGTNDYVALQAVNLSSTNKITICFFCRLLSYTEVPGSTKIILEVSANFNNTTTGLYIGYADESNSIYSSTFPISLSVKGDVGYNISGFNKNLVNDLKWHHWACVFDKSQTGVNPQETFLYIDGVYQTPTIAPTVTYRSDNTNNFGNDIINIGGFRPTSSSFPSNISLSNLQIYNRALSPQEVLQNYNATKSRFNLT